MCLRHEEGEGQDLHLLNWEDGRCRLRETSLVDNWRRYHGDTTVQLDMQNVKVCARDTGMRASGQGGEGTGLAFIGE